MTSPTGRKGFRCFMGNPFKVIQNQKGLTLIEMLLSIIILSVGLVAVERVLLASVSHLSYIENRSEVARLTANKIWEIQDELDRYGKLTIPRQGMLIGERKTYDYALKAQEVDSRGEFFEMELNIQWSESGRKKQVKRTFYASAPYSDETK